MPNVSLSPLLDMKHPTVCAPLLTGPVNNSFFVASRGPDRLIYYFNGAAVLTAYDPFEDAWHSRPTPGLATFAAGACGFWHPSGPTGTANPGNTSTTMGTGLTIVGDLRPRNGRYYTVRITAGTGAGQIRTIADSTYGVNSTITVATPWNVIPDNTSTYALMTGRVWVFGGGTLAAGSFRQYDYATNTWISRSITGLPATFSGDSRLVGLVPAFGPIKPFLTGFSSGSNTSTTFNDTSVNWGNNQWIGQQVTITSGTGAGQTRQVASNLATQIFVTAAWTTIPDATSGYMIEGSQDTLYLLGNNALPMYRYTISTDTWATVTQNVARAAAPGVGVSANWIIDQKAAPWTNPSAILNGRRIYSARANGTAVMDYFDIPTASWFVATSPTMNSTFNLGAGYAQDDTGGILFVDTVVASGPSRILRYDPNSLRTEPRATFLYPASATLLSGDRLAPIDFDFGNGPIQYLYWNINGTQAFYRVGLI
jgi:hypothetical protein